MKRTSIRGIIGLGSAIVVGCSLAIMGLVIWAATALADHVDKPDPGKYCQTYVYYVRYISVEPWEIVAYAYDPVTGQEIQKIKEVPPHPNPNPTGYTTGIISWVHKKGIYIREVEFNTLEPHQPFGIFLNCTSG